MAVWLHIAGEGCVAHRALGAHRLLAVAALARRRGRAVPHRDLITSLDVPVAFGAGDLFGGVSGVRELEVVVAFPGGEGALWVLRL